MQGLQEVSVAQDLQLNEIQAVIKALMLKMSSDITEQQENVSYLLDKQDSCLASKGEN